MDKALTLFLETSAFNFYIDGKQGQKRRDTIKLFDFVISCNMGHIDTRKTMIGRGSSI
jgi:hypothetical protein